MSTYTIAAVEARNAGRRDGADGRARRPARASSRFTLRQPIGVVGAISPFNFPLNLVAHKIAPALAAGCAVVLKPAAQTPLSALLLAELETEAGLPPGWLNVLVGPAAEIGDVLVEDERVQADHLHRLGRGRLEARRAGAAQAGQPRARERDAGDRRGGRRPRRRGRERLARTRSRSPARAASRSSGSTSSDRAYDDAARSGSCPKVEALVVGDPADEETDVGPLIDDDARERVLEWIEEARAAGAEVLTGGELDGELLRPTVIANAGPELKVSCEEVFGPVCTVDRVRHARRGDRARERDALRPAGGHLHRLDQDGARGGAAARVRRRDDQRGADVPGRPDAVRRRQGLRQHARRAAPGPCAS